MSVHSVTIIERSEVKVLCNRNEEVEENSCVEIREPERTCFN